MDDLDDILDDFKPVPEKPKKPSPKESPYFIADGGDLPPGIYYQPPAKKQGDEWITPAPIWICEEFAVVARSRDAEGGNHGKVLEWRDQDKVRHEFVFTSDMLSNDGLEIRKVLMNGGLQVSTKRAAKEHLVHYLNEVKPNKVARSVFAIGWQSGGAYVLPKQTYGE